MEPQQHGASFSSYLLSMIHMSVDRTFCSFLSFSPPTSKYQPRTLTMLLKTWSAGAESNMCKAEIYDEGEREREWGTGRSESE